MVDFDFTNHCCGCGVCVDACPRNCISIVEDSKDFRIPKVNTDECVNCGLCEKVCPVLNSEAPKGVEKLLCCYNKNEEQRHEGSSGSIFVLFADSVISDDGVVIGAAFDENLQLKHQVAHTMEEVKPLMKSKYIQSDTTGIFKQVKNFLKEEKQVLFVGTPCQCQALYNYLGKKRYEGLFLVDFICHGVPSQKLFDKAVQSYQQRHNCKVKSFSFREKANDLLRCYSMTYILNDGGAVKKEVGHTWDFPFYNGYLKYGVFRESCYECPFARRERVSDITLGDFWHLTKIKKEITDFHKGYSMVIVNTQKGINYIESITPLIVKEVYPIEIAEQNNFAYVHPTEKKLLHKLFIRDYNKKPFCEIERKYLCYPYGLNIIEKIINRILVKLKF